MQKTSNPNATQKAQELLDYLSDTAGKKLITGQHTQTIPMEEVAHIRSVTGRSPKLIGFELLSYSPNINYSDASEECLTEVEENRNTLEKALELAKNSDIILTFTFHWFSPLGGRDKSFYAENTDFDPDRILIEGTPERERFYHDMDVIAGHLKKFSDADIPILWRPFHEAEGKWFWWGSKGAETACELYKLMYRHYTLDHKLDNLLWVWNCPAAEAYPGDEFVDVVSMDVYLSEYSPTDYAEEYKRLIASTSPRKVCALAELGYMPDISTLERSHIPWAYYMTWSKEFCIGDKYNPAERLREMYFSGYAVTCE